MAASIISSQDSTQARQNQIEAKQSLMRRTWPKAMSDEEDRSGEAAASRIPDEIMKVASITHSEEETKRLGFKIGKNLSPGSIVCFFGDLAAGKTTFIKGIAKGAAGIAEEMINSPTFVYLNIYEGKIYHFDLYRLTDQRQFLALGFDEMLFGDGISCIEWSERIAPLLPPHCIRIEMEHHGQTSRKITIYGKVSI